MARYAGYSGFKPYYTQTLPAFLLIGILLGNILIYWVRKGVCIGLVPYYCLYSTRHRQVIAAIFVSVLLEPARSFCLACEEAPLMHAACCGFCVAACLPVSPFLSVRCRLDSSKETGSAAVWFVHA